MEILKIPQGYQVVRTGDASSYKIDLMDDRGESAITLLCEKTLLPVPHVVVAVRRSLEPKHDRDCHSISMMLLFSVVAVEGCVAPENPPYSSEFWVRMLGWALLNNYFVYLHRNGVLGRVTDQEYLRVYRAILHEEGTKLLISSQQISC